MAEISRSDAIKVMNTWKFICSLGDNVEPRAIGVTRFEMIDTCTKAISDMQKLDEIEKTIEWNCHRCGSREIKEECNECHDIWIEEIRNILRGGK